jgi:hypothetical protein
MIAANGAISRHITRFLRDELKQGQLIDHGHVYCFHNIDTVICILFDFAASVCRPSSEALFCRFDSDQGGVWGSAGAFKSNAQINKTRHMTSLEGQEQCAL